MNSDKKTPKRVVSAQLRIGDTASHERGDILKKIDAAVDLAGVQLLLFQPTRTEEVDSAILDHARKRNLEVYLWYQVLGDNECIPAKSELAQDAFGSTQAGDTGVWTELPKLEDTFLAACPTNHKYNRLILERAKRMLDGYDGLFLDAIGYPLPTLGIESLFTCFCRHCLLQEPRLADWRQCAHELRDRFSFATDADLERWGALDVLFGEMGLEDFIRFRAGLITDMTRRYVEMSRSLGKKTGIDVLAPAFAAFAGHDLTALGDMADWITPRIYCSTIAPSSIPLEFRCTVNGLKGWGHRMTLDGVAGFVGRTVGIRPPANLQDPFLSAELVGDQVEKTLAATRNPVFPSVECWMHPEFESTLDEQAVETYLEATGRAPGIVLAWNLMFIPDSFLKMVGQKG